MTQPATLMTIGDFARESGLSPKALRLYDDLGLLVPAEVDQHSGYRRYLPAQLGTARRVATLRLLGMPLVRIRQVLELKGAAAAAEVEAYWRQVEADTSARRDIVAALVNQMRNGVGTMNARTETLQMEIGTSHHRGRRDRQQDALVAQPGLVAVADGFGDRDDVAEAALGAFAGGGLAAAVAEVAPRVADAGTTLTALTIEGSTARITHIGDARVWLVRDGELRQVTHDHTIVAALVESGQLSTEEARSHPHRNLLNRALVPGVVADETAVDLQPGDRLVLTTDGVHGHLEDLASLLTRTAPPQVVADAVAAAVVGAGEPDNHTVVVADLS